ncbi:hypothetical protein EC968_010657 [Mortierella alpina]|nr:hypothetical protein EC968_010657 [Mortierella alpina]
MKLLTTSTLLVLAVFLCVHPGPASSTKQLEAPQTHPPGTAAIPLIRARRRDLARRSTPPTVEEIAEETQRRILAAMAEEAARRAREAIEKAREKTEGTAADGAVVSGEGEETTKGDRLSGESGSAGDSGR